MFTNAQQNIPPLFKEIMRNDAERAELRAPKVILFYEAEKYAELQREKADFRKAAERALRMSMSGNTA